MNNMFISLFADMQHFNHNSIFEDRDLSWSHSHEELLLQGRMTVTRTCNSISLQGPHNILMAQAEVITPAGIHHIRIYPHSEQKRTIGTFREWDRNLNPPTLEHQRLLQKWCQELPPADRACMRMHRTVREAKTCNGNIRPVIEMSDSPRGVAPRNQGNRGRNFGPKTRGQGAMNRRGQASPRRYVPITPKPSGNVFHFRATDTPGTTVQLHAPPTPDHEITVLPSFLQTWPMTASRWKKRSLCWKRNF